MPLLFLIWLLAFLLQSGLLGAIMYTVIQLTDLENDYINPHDAATNINRLVYPEFAAQAALTALLLLSGRWAFGLLNAALLAYHARQFLRRQHLADVTEIFRQVAPRRRAALHKLAAYLLGFVWTVYALIDVAIHALLSPAGRKAARSLLQEAAATLQR